jgi:hypothetical protein
MRYSEIKSAPLEEDRLEEANMSPAALAAFAKTPFAQSMQVGFEAEMLVPGLSSEDDDDAEMEPDWDMDERLYVDSDWRDSLMSFFMGGDTNNTRRDVLTLAEDLTEAWTEWADEKFESALHPGSGDLAQEFYDKVKDHLGKDATEEDIDNAINDDYDSRWMERIRDEMRDKFLSDDGPASFVRYMGRELGIRTMRDVWRWARRNSAGDLGWPHYVRQSGGDTSVDDLEASFVEATGYTATVSRGYHGAQRRPGVWIFEPDSSIDAGDLDGYGGIELVSPPMPLEEAISALDEFHKWATKLRCKSNKSTGFHMGVSIPQQSFDNVDHFKLMLFLGDQYVLKMFNRSNNQYTKSLLKRISEFTKAGRFDATKFLQVFKSGMNSKAAEAVRSNIMGGSDRYVSINIKSNYVEFRSAGGNYFNHWGDIESVMLRYVRAMGIAADPEAERQEYAKKAYKLISAAIQNDDQLAPFAAFVSGMINQEQLKSALLNKQKQKKPPAPPPPTAAVPPAQPGQAYYRFNVVRAVDGWKVHEFLASGNGAAQAMLHDWATRNGSRPEQYRAELASDEPVYPAGTATGSNTSIGTQG